MFDLILDSVEDFHTVEVRRLHRIFGGLRPVGLGLPHVDMGEALSGVHAHAAPVRHQRPGVGRHRCRGLALHGNVSRRAVAVLAVGRAAYLGVL